MLLALECLMRVLSIRRERAGAISDLPKEWRSEIVSSAALQAQCRDLKSDSSIHRVNSVLPIRIDLFESPRKKVASVAFELGCIF